VAEATEWATCGRPFAARVSAGSLPSAGEREIFLSTTERRQRKNLGELHKRIVFSRAQIADAAFRGVKKTMHIRIRVYLRSSAAKFRFAF
jgi:hypothetical protein